MLECMQVLHMRRFTKNNFFVEKNPTIVNFPVKNLKLRDIVPVPTGAPLTRVMSVMRDFCIPPKSRSLARYPALAPDSCVHLPCACSLQMGPTCTLQLRPLQCTLRASGARTSVRHGCPA